MGKKSLFALGNRSFYSDVKLKMEALLFRSSTLCLDSQESFSLSLKQATKEWASFDLKSPGVSGLLSCFSFPGKKLSPSFLSQGKRRLFLHIRYCCEMPLFFSQWQKMFHAAKSNTHLGTSELSSEKSFFFYTVRSMNYAGCWKFEISLSVRFSPCTHKTSTFSRQLRIRILSP